MSENWQADLVEAHRLLCPEQIGTTPAMPDEDVTMLRLRLVDEEHDEFRDAMLNDDISGVADAIGDLVYVLLGTAVAMGIDMAPVWNAIHIANLSKANGPRRADGKWLKGPTWAPPDIPGVLSRQRPLSEIYPEPIEP